MLPIELWRKIFRDSVHIPGLLDTEWNPDHMGMNQPNSELVWTGWPSVKELSSRSQNGMRTRTSIVLVSRLWQEMGKEFLYECITIHRREDLSTLLTAFKSDSDADPRRRRGWWPKRVEVSAELKTGPDNMALQQFLICCANVQILSTPLGASRGNPFRPLLPTISQHFRHSLRRIPLTIDHVPAIEAQCDWLSAIPFQSLEVDVGSSSGAPTGHSHQALLSSPFHNVTTLALTLHAFADERIQWHFPRLQHMSLTTTGFNHYDFLIPFLVTHAETLTSMHIVSADVIGDLSEVLATSVNLRNLALDHVEFKDLSPSVVLLKIEFLCIHVLPTLRSISGFASALESMLSAGALPSLRHLQVTGIDDRENSEGIAPLRSFCTTHQVEFHLGPLTPPSYSIYSGVF